MYESLLKQIKEFDNITIFRHKKPDGDAVFSSYALKEFIKSNFKDKHVKCVGNDVYDVYPKTEKTSDKFIKNSLAIILDCSTEDRTDDNRYKLAKYRIIIDHHPGNLCHADKAFVDTNVSATCELLAKMLYSKEFSKYSLNKKVCKFLYCGMLTDSLSFKTSNTASQTLFLASKLINDGQLIVSDLYEYVFSSNYKHFENITKLRTYFKLSNGVGYIKLTQDDLDNLNMSFSEAKNCIDEFNKIREVKIWAIFAYNSKEGWYDGSIRSKRKYVINSLCTKYNGGGHKNACGVKKMTDKSIKELVKNLEKIANC